MKNPTQIAHFTHNCTRALLWIIKNKERPKQNQLATLQLENIANHWRGEPRLTVPNFQNTDWEVFSFFEDENSMNETSYEMRNAKNERPKAIRVVEHYTNALMKSLIRKYQPATLFIGFVSEKMENFFLMLYIPRKALQNRLPLICFANGYGADSKAQEN